MGSAKRKSAAYKITDHPIILSAVICFFGAFFLGFKPFTTNSYLILVLAAITISIFTFLSVPNEKPLSYSVFMSCGFILLLITLYFLFAAIENKGSAIFCISVFLAVIYVLYCYLNNTLNTEKIIKILFFLAFMLKLGYILYTSISQRQHDVELFESTDDGHGAYILYLLNNRSLPDFDVRDYWQFYHPPLHHIISAVWLWIQLKCGIAFNTACEGIQFLTLFYSTLSLYLSYKIMREFHLRRTGLVTALAILAFHPTFIIFSGSVNNDILSITFMLGAVYNTMVWFKNRTVWNILKIALCVGLGMFTKVSAWIVAPAIAAVFLIALIKNEGKIKKLIGQYASFLLVCAPIGLFWSVRNYLLYKLPFTYVPRLPDTSQQYIGYHSVIERLFDFNFNQFESVFNQMEFYDGKYFEYNPTIGLFKTALFDETVNDTYFPQITFWGTAMFWLSVILGVFGFVAMIYILFRRKSMVFAYKILLIVLYFSIFISYYSFCFIYPFTCTQNIRYASPLIIIGAISIGKLISLNQNNNSEFSKFLRCSVTFITVCFCFTSAATYTLIGI